MCSGLLQWVYEVKRMKNKVIHFVDILTVIILMIILQSEIVFIKGNCLYVQNSPWYDYMWMYSISGISDMIRRSSYDFIYNLLVFIVYISSFYVITVKLIDLWKKELISGTYRWFIVINICFVIFKTVDFLIELDAAFSI